MASSKTFVAPAAAPRDLAEFFVGPPRRNQQWLADKLGCHQSFVSMLVHRTRACSLKMALAINRLTGVPIAALQPKKPRKKKKPPGQQELLLTTWTTTTDSRGADDDDPDDDGGTARPFSI